MKFRVLIMVSLYAGALLAQAEEKYPASLSLEEAQQFALENAYSVRDAQKELQKSKQTIRETRAMGLPQISSSLNYNLNADIAKQPVPAEFAGGPPGEFVYLAFGQKHNTVGSLSYNQLLFDASYIVALQATRVVKETYALRLERSEITVKHDVAEAYYGALISNRLVGVLEENKESLEKNFFEVQKLYENGFSEEQDVDQLELLVNQTTNALNNAKRQQELARMLLNFNLGIPVETKIDLTTDVEEIVVSDQLLEKSQQFEPESHIDFRTARSQQRGASLQVKKEKSDYLPSLSGFVRHQQSNFQNEFDEAFSFNTYWIPSTVIGGTLSWDIFSGFRRSAQKQKAELDLERTEINKNLTRNQVQLSYQRARSNYLNALANYENTKRNVEISKSIRDKTLTKFNEGLSGSLQLTQAQNQYLEAEQQSLSALQNILSAREELKEALGE